MGSSFSDQIKKLQKASRDLAGKKEVPVADLLTPAFLRKHTSFATADALFVALGIESIEGFKALSEAELDKRVAKATRYKGWGDLLGEAYAAYAAKKLGF